MLFAVQLRLDVDDIEGLATDALTDGHDDKACDLIYVDRNSGIILIAQGTEYGCERQVADVGKVSSLHQAVNWIISHDVEKIPKRFRPAVDTLRAAIEGNAIREI